MKKKVFVLLAVMLAMLQLQPALALKVVKPGDDAYYLDTAGVLSEATEGEIYFCNELLKEATGAEIAIVALDSINGEDTYEYAYTLFNEWGIGSSQKNNGFLLLMAIEEDDYYALSGSGVDRIFTASVLGEMYDEYLEPDFAAKRYDQGARKFFEAVFAKFADYYNLDLTVQDGIAAYNAYTASGGTIESPSYTYEEEGNDFMYLLAVIAIIVLLSVVLRGNTRGRGGRTSFFFFGTPRRHVHHRPPHGPGPGPFDAGHRPGGFGGGRPPFGGGSSFGSGAGRSTHCSSGFGGGRSFGGRSGFGGGSFGGGRSSGGGAGRGRR